MQGRQAHLLQQRWHEAELRAGTARPLDLRSVRKAFEEARNGSLRLAEELRGEEFDPTGGDRASFLARVTQDLAARDSSDAKASRARIHEKHRKRKRKRPESEGGSCSLVR